MASNPTETLADFVAFLKPEEIPEQVRRRALSIFVDSIACAWVGRTGPETRRMKELSAQMTGSGQSTVVGGGSHSSMAGATLINSYQITAFNLCDVYRPAHCHMAPLVLAPTLAAGESTGVSGDRFLAAIVAGLETACRVGRSLDYTEFRRRGWHSPGVIGPFGGAAATAYLHDADPLQMRNALGLAGSQSAGTMAQWGTPTIKFHQSRGALSGLMAGLLAVSGYSAGANVIADAETGVVSMFSGRDDAAGLVEGLGEAWELMNISLKRWPSGSGLQTTVSALFDLIRHHDLRPDRIEKVNLWLPGHAFEAHGAMGWEDKFKAMLSARYITSVILHDGRCWTDQFDDDRRLDPAIDEFARTRVKVEADRDLAPSASRTRIQLTDGTTIEDSREAPKGDPTDPLDLDEIVSKYRDSVQSREAGTDGLDGLLDLAGSDDVRPVIAALGA